LILSETGIQAYPRQSSWNSPESGSSRDVGSAEDPQLCPVLQDHSLSPQQDRLRLRDHRGLGCQLLRARTNNNRHRLYRPSLIRQSRQVPRQACNWWPNSRQEENQDPVEKRLQYCKAAAPPCSLPSRFDRTDKGEAGETPGHGTGIEVVLPASRASHLIEAPNDQSNTSSRTKLQGSRRHQTNTRKHQN
jgi:hypothetical protein